MSAKILITDFKRQCFQKRCKGNKMQLFIYLEIALKQCNTNKSLLVKWKFRARKSSKSFLQAVSGDNISPSSLLFFIQYAFQCLLPLNWIECAQSNSLLAYIQRWGNTLLENFSRWQKRTAILLNDILPTLHFTLQLPIHFLLHVNNGIWRHTYP